MHFFSLLGLLLLLAACGKSGDGLDNSDIDVTSVADELTAEQVTDPELLFDPQPVSNFTLLDQTGKAHELFYYDDSRAIVIMVHGNGCPVVRNSYQDYVALTEKYRHKGIRFFMLNSNLQDDRASIVEELALWGISIPVLDDDNQMVGRELGLSRTAEVLIIDPRKRKIVYRGPLHDRVSYESQADTPTLHYTERALDAILAKESVLAAEEPVKGCLINFPALTEVSYQNDVVPILLDKCIVCHQEGGIAPWAMSSHAMVQGFAPMIKEVLRTKRMPPYDADTLIGHWQDNPILSGDEINVLLSWINGGAGKGEGQDPLLDRESSSHDWPYGEPDLIIDIPAFDIPATGTIDYRYADVPNTYDKDVWLVGAAIKPGDSLALHHLHVGISKAKLNISKSISDDYLLSWSPGTNVGAMPFGTGVFLERGSRLLFEMHYTSYGKASVDQSKLGLYFTKRPPKKILRYGETANLLMEIPPYKRSHLVSSYTVFDRDATIYMLVPHAHYRGKSFKYVYRYPDGSEELALSVPMFDFNWQRGYFYQEPKKIPAGTMLVVSAEYDNSIFNDANPDPSQKVIWGPQSKDEMLTGAFTFSWDEETSNKKIHDSRKWVISRRVGYLDVNMDGEIVKSELPANRRRHFDQFAAQVDANEDGAVTYQEWHAKPDVEYF